MECTRKLLSMDIIVVTQYPMQVIKFDLLKYVITIYQYTTVARCHDHQQYILSQQSTIHQGQPHYNHHQQKIHLQWSTHPSAHREVMAISTHIYLGFTLGHLKQMVNMLKKKPAPVKTMNSLSKHKIPANSPILWELSQDVREWRFLGRYLDLEEETIDEIDYNTIPNRTRDR